MLKTVKRQRAIRRTLQDGIRLNMWNKVGRVYTSDVMYHVDAETNFHPLFWAVKRLIQESRNHPTVQRQRKVRNMLHNSSREKAYTAVKRNTAFDIHSKINRGMEQGWVRGMVLGKQLKDHMRMIMFWLDVIDGNYDDSSEDLLRHSIRCTRHVAR